MAKVMITEAMATRYLKTGGQECPFCHAEEIEGGSVEIDAGYAYQRMTCTVCQQGWDDSYKLVAIMPNRFTRLTEQGNESDS